MRETDLSTQAPSPESVSDTDYLTRFQAPSESDDDAADDVSDPTGVLAPGELASLLDSQLQISSDTAPEQHPSDEGDAELLAAALPVAGTPLDNLLLQCGQGTQVEALPDMDTLLGQHVDLSSVRKIGEGTFGEAFKARPLLYPQSIVNPMTCT